MKKFLQKVSNLISVAFVCALTMIFLVIISKNVSDKTFLIITIVCLVFAVAGIVVLSIFRKFNYSFAICVILICNILFVMRIFSIKTNYESSLGHILESDQVIGYVSEHPITKHFPNGDALEFRFKVVAVKTRHITDFISTPNFDILVKTNIPRDLTADTFLKGDKLRLDCPLNVPKQSDVGFNYRDYLFSNGVYAVSQCSFNKIERLGSRLSLPSVDLRKFSKAIYIWRSHFIEKFRVALSKKCFGFFMSVFLGQRSELSCDISEDFRTSGMMHLIAISGMHISVIGGLVFLLFSKIFSKSISYICSLAVLYLYISLLPFQPSSQRAFIMYAVVVLFFVCGNKSGSLTGISFAAIILIFINPFCIYNIGFQFSFLATAGIILFNSQINEALENVLKGKIFDKIRDNLSVTIAAFCSISLVQIGIFGQIAIVSLLTSLVLIPIFEIVFVSLFFGGILLFISNFAIFAKIMNVITDFFLFLVNLASNIPMIALPKLPSWVGYLSIPLLFILFNLVFPIFVATFSKIKNYIRLQIYEKKMLKTN